MNWWVNSVAIVQAVGLMFQLYWTKKAIRASRTTKILITVCPVCNKKL